jgi:hypothetical protein
MEFVARFGTPAGVHDPGRTYTLCDQVCKIAPGSKLNDGPGIGI